MVSSTQITATFGIAANATMGPAGATVTTSSSGTSGPVTFSVIAPVPTLTAITPSSGTAATTVPVTLTGANFTSGATVTAPAGIAVSNLSVVSATQINATFTIASNATVGGYAITVTTAGGSSTGYTDPFGQVWSADTGFNNGGFSVLTNAVNGTNIPTLYNRRPDLRRRPSPPRCPTARTRSI